MSEFKPNDYYLVDDLLSDEHKLIRSSVREFVNREVKPIIEKSAQDATFPKHLISKLAHRLSDHMPEEYGGAG